MLGGKTLMHIVYFISFIIGLALLPYIELFVSPYIPNMFFLPWIVTRIVAFLFIFIILPKIFTSVYISYQKSKVRG